MHAAGRIVHHDAVRAAEPGRPAYCVNCGMQEGGDHGAPVTPHPRPAPAP